MEIKEIYSLFLQSEGIVTDSRSVKKNTIFFALTGQNFDGNQFARNAIESGAAWAVVDDPAVVRGNEYILVDDVLETLQNLASYYRRITGIKIIAITGSNGKTTTKELLKNVLSEKYSVGATQGNLNNHIGVPLTLLNFPINLNIGIVEMGANHPGEIANLCKIAEPDFGLITNIGKAHLEGFGSLEGVARAKAELYDYLADKNGAIFINAENDRLLKVLPSNAKNIIYYGNSKSSSVCFGKLTKSEQFIKFILSANIKKDGNSADLEVSTRLIGNYNLENLVAAACVGLHFNISPNEIKKAIESYIPSNSRSEFIQTGNNTLIMDAYNANPTSMLAAIENFFELKAERKFLILGEMLELGASSYEEHKSIVDSLINNKWENVILVGAAFEKIKGHLMKFNNVQDLVDWLKIEKLSGYHILIKGSRGNKLEEIIPYL